MQCQFNIPFSSDWVNEKISCINHLAMAHANQIKELLQHKFNIGEHFLTPNEFAEILVFKGLAKSKKRFLYKYHDSDEVQGVTREIFNSGLNDYNFDDTIDQQVGRDILDTASNLIHSLCQLKFVGIPVASAYLTLAIPHLFGTVDYIVPGMLHCIEDDLGILNPLRENLQNINGFQESLLLLDGQGMSPDQIREITKTNYRQYIKELWNIKRTFNLDFKIADIEVSLWSYGICYIKKQKANNNDYLPFRFQQRPNPPRGGSFAKNCPDS